MSPAGCLLSDKLIFSFVGTILGIFLASASPIPPQKWLIVRVKV
jgi:hypothetical protein